MMNDADPVYNHFLTCSLTLNSYIKRMFWVDEGRNTIGDHERIGTARAAQTRLQSYNELRDMIATLGVDELAKEDKLLKARSQGSTCRSGSSDW